VGALAGAAPMTNNVQVTGVAVGASFTFTFNSPIDIHSAIFTGLRLALESNSNVTIPLTYNLSADQKVLTVIPLSPLSNATQYRFYLNYFGNIRDTTGTAENDGSRQFPFTTVP
jgi:hypothetical protein